MEYKYYREIIFFLVSNFINSIPFHSNTSSAGQHNDTHLIVYDWLMFCFISFENPIEYTDTIVVELKYKTNCLFNWIEILTHTHTHI